MRIKRLFFALIVVFYLFIVVGCNDSDGTQLNPDAPVITIAAISFIIPNAPISLKSPTEPITRALDWQKIDILFCTDEPVEYGAMAYFEIFLNGALYESKNMKLQPGNCWTYPYGFESAGDWSFELSIANASGEMSLSVDLGIINVTGNDRNKKENI